MHHRWTAAEFRLRTKLNKLDDRIFVVVETDALPIELRTTLFTPDRSQLLANEAALQLEDQVANFLDTWNPLTDLNKDLIRDAVQRATGSKSAVDVARRISAALKVRGFALNGSGSAGGGRGGGGVVAEADAGARSSSTRTPPRSRARSGSSSRTAACVSCSTCSTRATTSCRHAGS